MMPSVPLTFASLLVLAGVLMLGEALRRAAPQLRRYFLPASVVAGVLALLAGPQVAAPLAAALGAQGTALAEHGLVPGWAYETWSLLPGLLINVVFAALFLGRRIPGLREIWYRAGPQVVVGQTMAWGQYVVGIGLTVAVLTPVFGLSPMAGALIEVGFEGGHGTAAGMAASFEELGFAAGADLALGLATVGLLTGILLGTILVNRAARLGIIDPDNASRPAWSSSTGTSATSGEAEEGTDGGAADSLALHLGWIGLAVGAGWLLQQALVGLEQLTWAARGVEVLVHVPLFPLAMVGGVLVQWALQRSGRAHWIRPATVDRIAGSALDFTIVAALATLSLVALGEHVIPFLLLATAGTCWSLFVLMVVAPRVIPWNWFERGVGDFGQSMGVTVTGLLLMRMADPRNRSGCYESFGYKQLLFEPIVGGGLFTAASVPLIAQFGPVPMLLFTAVVAAGWVAFGRWCFGGMIPPGRQGLWGAARRRG